MEVAMRLAIAFVATGAILWAGLGIAAPPDSMLLVNSSSAKWEHDAGDPAGSESITLREDPTSGATELFARYPAGHVFAPHWHSANERVVLLEGRMSIQDGEKKKMLEAGGYAYLPAKVPQKMACVSSTACSFYVYWDGKLDFHKAE
jgi:glyoxylate utilization-related uncharacterized protein